MRTRRTEFRHFSAMAFACWLLVLTGASFSPTAAGAAPLDEVAASVAEVTAPVEETVETVVPPPPPAPAPAPASQPPVQVPQPVVPVPQPVVDVPPVKLPEAPVKASAPAPVKPPAASTGTVTAVVKTAKQSVEMANGAVTEAAGNLSSAGAEAAGTVERSAGNAVDTVERTASAATAPAEEVPGTRKSATAPAPGNAQPRSSGPTASTTASGAAGSSTGAPPAEALAAPAGSDRPDLRSSVPARFLDPFIHVWPAIALTVEGPLGNYVRQWSRALLALFEASGGSGSLRADVGPLASSTPAAPDPSGQPAYSRIPSPSLAPFNRIASEGALMVVVFFVLLATATLTILGLARRELGLPVFRRGRRSPWGH